MTILAKTYQQGKERLFAACDQELLGKTLRDDPIKFEVLPTFYGDDPVDEQEFERHMQQCTVANLVGQRCVELAIRLGFVDPQNVLHIQGVPHAQYAVLF